MRHAHLSLLASAAALMLGSAHAGFPAWAVKEATIHNFAVRDLLRGDDGLPPHPTTPLKYGAPTVHLDVDGNMIEEHTASVSYFNGKYYMYAWKQACGTLVFFSGTIPGLPRPTPYPPGDYGGACGLTTYSSDDLTNWKFENLFQPTGLPGNAVKPQVHWSPGLQKYVMWFRAGNNLARTGGLYVSLADTPAGPWGPQQLATGDYLAHDFDIVVAPNGVGYILTNVFSGQNDPTSPGGARPLWDHWIQELNVNMTGTVGTPQTQHKLMHAVDWEAVGFIHFDGYWYITGGPTCANCEVPIEYLRAPAPLGPWTNEDGFTGPALRHGTLVAENGCGGQNKGAEVLPSAAGPVPVSSVWGYRTGPTNYTPQGEVVHGDNSQAISSTYWFPLEFDSARRMKPWKCEARVKIPLAETVRRHVAAPKPYQPDCRIRSDSSLEQTWKFPRLLWPFVESVVRSHWGGAWGGAVANDAQDSKSLRIPVFQRTDDKGPYAQDGPVMNGPLVVDVEFANGTHKRVSFAATDISWAPEVVSVPLDGDGHGDVPAKITLSTQATNGCYGVVVEPESGMQGRYSQIEGGRRKVAPAAEMVIHGPARARGGWR